MKYSEENFDELCSKEGIVNEGSSWSNDSPKFNFDLFPCYGCLRKYKYWWMSRLCRWIHFTISPNGIPAQMVR